MGIYVAQWKINGPIDGISESYYGSFDDLAEAIDAATTTMRVRACLLADNVNIMDARVSSLDLSNGPDSPNPPDAYHIGGLPMAGVPADPSAAAGELHTNIGADSIHVQMRTSRNTLANRHLRYCPDRWTSASVFVPAGLSSIQISTAAGIPALDPAMVTGTTPSANLTIFLRCLIAYYGAILVTDRFPRRGTQTKGRPKAWDVAGYTTGRVVRPATRRTGRPFGPFRGRRRNRCAKKCK